jgi:DNA (cytosine-5)-methyltransferase 1
MLKMLDLFSGVGVGVATQAVGGIEEYGVEIMPAAIATRDGLGFNTPYNDVWEIDKAQELGFGPDWAMWDSPPCPTFSIAGRGTGRKALDNVLAAIHNERYKDIHAIKALGAEIGGSDGDKTALVLTPLAYIHRYRPRFIGMEQVPAVLPVWEAHRGPLEELGYSVWVGYLTSEMYGVPQTRKRAYLIARRDGIQAAPPTPTHSRYYSRDPKRMDEGVLPWVSMAEALGWGMTRRPSPTLTSHLGVTRSPSGTQGAYLDAIRSGGFIFKPVEPKASNVARNGIGSLYAPNTVNMDTNEGGLLNSFPDNFPFQGTKTQRDTIVGNAVPVLVARAIIATAPTD